jgi:hypothetical protein
MTTNKKSNKSDLSKIIITLFSISGFLSGILLGVGFVSILFITFLMIIGIFYVRSDEQYGNVYIGDNSIKFLSSVTCLLLWILGFMVNSLI